MSRLGFGRTAFVCLAVAFAAWPASASNVTVAFSGSIVDVQDPDGIGDGSVVAGTPFAGSFTIDTTLREREESFPDPNRAFFVPGEEGVPFEFSVTVGRQLFFVDLELNGMFGGPGAGFDIFDGPAPFGDEGNLDRFQFRTSFPPGNSLPFEQGGTLIDLVLSAPGGGAISSTSLEQLPFDLAVFPDARLNLFVSPRFAARGRIDRLRVVAEPGAVGLLALGLAVLLRRRGRA